MTQINTLQELLKKQAETSPDKRLKFYPPGGATSPSREVSYADLYFKAISTSPVISALPNFVKGSPVLLHLDDHWDTILFFWATLFANGIPVLSSPLSNVEEHRQAHLLGLSRLLNSPPCITRETCLSLFEGGAHTLRLHTVEALLREGRGISGHGPDGPNGTPYSDPSPPAVLMLTSGSTGNAKAVRLSHTQILTSIAGKASTRPTPYPFTGSLLNWINLDHVCSLIEIHLAALWLGVDQIHAPTADMVSSPLLFPELLSRHRVFRTFAPNFFLAKLVSSLMSDLPGQYIDKSWDLSNLNSIMSGGERNDLDTCTKAASFLSRYGAPFNVVVPGFGMTETCAGAIFNLDCPRYDASQNLAVASLGKCVSGIQMRITTCNTTTSRNLELKGPIVFEGYYNNVEATADAFTSDGWFRTGDQGFVDEQGNLNLVGRSKEVININGVKIETAEIQAAVEKALRDSITCAGRVVCFPSRAVGAATEQVTVGYLPSTEWPPSPEEMEEVERLAVKACMMVSTAGRPVVFGVGEETKELVPVSSLGKVSGAKMRELFERGVFERDVDFHRRAVDGVLRSREKGSQEKDLTELEVILKEQVCEAIGIGYPVSVGVDNSFFDMGFTSIDLIQLKRRVDTRLETAVPAITFLQHSSVRQLAKALGKLGHGSEKTEWLEEYDPVVVFRPAGSKTPLWLIHPGVGEVLIFVRLAEQLMGDDRPIYALRARGFESGQPAFSSITEAVDAYASAIKAHQPNGPYALAGYCYGGMLAFEIAKKLDALSQSGEEAVRFLGSFDLPPHIKDRMRQLGWNWCFLYLAQFVDAITEQQLEDEEDSFLQLSRDEAFDRVMGIANVKRLEELGMDKETLLRWVNVAYELHHMAVDYEPSGTVNSIDVFHAHPLRIAAKSREEWVNDKLSRWKDFCTMAPRFHEVGGAHYTMLGPDYVAGFAKTLREALARRGI
ncbi:hypothetical protein QBC44DRAFT_391877 [Cladorrhinum sp. PSN332]|nr:hypothetical protein QBC44DRAFT_391877 [Cladorrhinum sp. PSN332]